MPNAISTRRRIASCIANRVMAQIRRGAVCGKSDATAVATALATA